MPENEVKPAEMQHRFVVQIFGLDNSLENPIQGCYALKCHDEQSARMIFESLQRICQILTYSPDKIVM